jgi:general secretion pathway protein G
VTIAISRKEIRTEEQKEAPHPLAPAPPPGRGGGARSVIGWILIGIAVIGGGQQLSEKGFLGSVIETLPTVAFMVALGVGLIRRWSGKRIGLTLASVLAIPMFLVIALPTMSRDRTDTARIVAARSQIHTFITALGSYKLDTGTFPTTGQGLQALRSKPHNVREWAGPYVAFDIPKDPWGRDYVYRYPGEHGDEPDIISYGRDGQPGGEGPDSDIVSWIAGVR